MRRSLILPALMSTLGPHAAGVAQEAPLTLQDAVASALRDSPRLKTAEAQAQGAEARVTTADLNRVGRVETTYLYTPSQKPLAVAFPGIPGVMPPASFEVKLLARHSFQVALSQPLWTWGALSGQSRAARLEREASRLGLDRARQQTAFEASRAFLQAAEAAEGVRVAEQALAQQQGFLKVATSRFEAGAAPRLDVLKAELAVARAESNLLVVRGQAALAREALVNATLDLRFREAPLAPLAPSQAPLPDEATALARAQAQRTDLQALGRQGEAATTRTRAARASGLPTLAFRAGLTQQNEAFAKAFQSDSQTYQVGLALTWDGTAPLRARARAAEQGAQARMLREELRQAEQGLVLEVRSAWLKVREARDREAVEARAVTVAEEQARVARLAYREGVLTSVEAQEAELALTAARFNTLRASLDAALAYEAFRFALGE